MEAYKGITECIKKLETSINVLEGNYRRDIFTLKMKISLLRRRIKYIESLNKLSKDHYKVHQVH